MIRRDCWNGSANSLGVASLDHIIRDDDDPLTTRSQGDTDNRD
jgi:hypothetical protein